MVALIACRVWGRGPLGSLTRRLFLTFWFSFAGFSGIFIGIRSARAQLCEEGAPSAYDECANGCNDGANNFGTEYDHSGVPECPNCQNDTCERDICCCDSGGTGYLAYCIAEPYYGEFDGCNACTE